MRPHTTLKLHLDLGCGELTPGQKTQNTSLGGCSQVLAFTFTPDECLGHLIKLLRLTQLFLSDFCADLEFWKSKTFEILCSSRPKSLCSFQPISKLQIHTNSDYLG